MLEVRDLIKCYNFDGFVTLALSRRFRGFSVQTMALRQAAVSAPLALSLFVQVGFRYLFCQWSCGQTGCFVSTSPATG